MRLPDTPVKYAACASRFVGVELLRFLIEQDRQPEFIVTHSSDEREHEIANLCRQAGVKCYRGLDVNSTEFIQLNREFDIDLLFLLWWPVIIRKPSLKSANIGFINLHPSLLPHNRGMNPYYWSIVNGSPAGVTIHLVDEKIDHGDILFQKRLHVPITETGESLRRKTELAMIELFRENLHRILALNWKQQPQQSDSGSFHRVKDMIKHSEIHLNKTYQAADLINKIRARSFTGGDSAYFYHQDKKYQVRISIEEVEADSDPNETKPVMMQQIPAPLK